MKFPMVISGLWLDKLYKDLKMINFANDLVENVNKDYKFINKNVLLLGNNYDYIIPMEKRDII